MVVASYFAVNRRAVLNFLNPFKTKQFTENYFNTIIALHENDQYSIKCFRTIYLVLLFQASFQVYLYVFPFQWQRLLFFDLFDPSNNYPSIFKLNFSAIFLMVAYMFHMLYVQIYSEKMFKQFYEYHQNDSKTFVKRPSSGLKKVLLLTLNVYQVFMLAATIYLAIEYIVFTRRIFRSDSMLVWTEWVEFVSMSIFFVSFTLGVCLFVYISYTCVGYTVFTFLMIVFRFRETHRPLAWAYCRFTTVHLLRFVRRNIGTMQFVFSINRLYGPILLSFITANLPMNVFIATYLLHDRFSLRQKISMLAVFVGQLSCFLGVHLMAAFFSKSIHRPYPKFHSLIINIEQCPVRARICLANTFQAFHIKSKKYGITYGQGKWTFGLVTMMTFIKFILLYGELLMYQYHQPDEV